MGSRGRIATWVIGLLVLAGCLDPVTVSISPASISYSLPSEKLGPGSHAMPGRWVPVLDGRVTGWNTPGESWSQEWHDAATLQIAAGEDEETGAHIFSSRAAQNPRHGIGLLRSRRAISTGATRTAE